MNTELKVGDKVRATRAMFDQEAPPPGVGTIVNVSDSGMLEIDFPEWDGGHGGNSGDGRTTRWWYVSTEELELVTDLPPALTEAKPPLLPPAPDFATEALARGEAIHEAVAGMLVSESDDDMRDRIAAGLLQHHSERLNTLLDAGKKLDDGLTFDGLAATWSFDMADAYMAERAKRRART